MNASAWLVVAVFLAIAPAGPATTVPKTGLALLADVSAGPAKKNAVFSISVGDCTRTKGAPPTDPAECSIVVALKKGGTGKASLEWRPKGGAISRPHPNSALIGLADDAEHQMSLHWSAVIVGNPREQAGINGLLITQETHGEKSKRRHDLFLARGGKLDHAFRASEGRGSKTWSALSAADVDHDGGAELVLMLASTNDEAEADSWEMQVFGWRADIAKIIARSDLVPVVKGAVVAMTRSLAEARKLGADPCAKEMLVLDSKSAGLLADGQFVVAYPTASKADAELVLAEVRACNPALIGAIKELTTGIDVDAHFTNDE